jgi:peptide/nickel transport system substrate-binding protein
MVLLTIALAAATSWGGPKKEGATATATTVTGAYKEAPMLAAMVKAGTLPSLDQRLPANPKVIESVESIGKFGGQLSIYATADIPNQDLQEVRYGFGMLRIPRSGIGLEPDLAENFELDRAGNSITLFLRKGLKWSDGHPLTAEDVRFAFEDMHFMAPEVVTWGAAGVSAVEVIDDYTVKIIRGAGLGVLPLQLSTWYGSQTTTFQPAHYLKTWHIRHNPDADKLAKEAGREHWYQLLYDKYWWWPIKNTELPRADAWILKEFGTTQKVYERNPYFWRVDSAGNQLPYIDRVVFSIVDSEVYQLKVTAGAADLAYMWTTLDNLALYKANEAAGSFRTILYPGTMSTAYTILWIVTQKDPAMRDLVSNLKFRQAMSVAVNRAEMNEVLLFGMGKPSNPCPLPTVSFYQQGWCEHYAQYDPALANRLLDEIGLTKRDANGFRLRPDGQPLTVVVDYASARLTPALELVTEYWKKIGVNTATKLEDVSLMAQRRTAGEITAWAHQLRWVPPSGEREMFLNAWVWSSEAGHAPLWDQWLVAKQRAVQTIVGVGKPLPANWRRMDTPSATLPGEKPPEEWIAISELEEQWQNSEPGSAQYRELGARYIDFFIQHMYTVGTVGQVPNVVVAKSNLGNVVPPGFVSGYDPSWESFMMQWADQLYWK